MLDGDLDQNRPCQRKDNSAYFSDVSTRQLGDSPGFADARGWTYHNTWVIDAKDLERPDARDEWEVGEVVQNPCCTINFHEVGHAMGLEHTYCAHSAVGRWEDRPYMTATWSTDDLAGMAVHLDPRTTHGMTIHEAADALGIAQDDRFDDMVANRGGPVVASIRGGRRSPTGSTPTTSPRRTWRPTTRTAALRFCTTARAEQ